MMQSRSLPIDEAYSDHSIVVQIADIGGPGLDLDQWPSGPPIPVFQGLSIQAPFSEWILPRLSRLDACAGYSSSSRTGLT